MEETNNSKYNSYVKKSILANNEFGITDINQLTSIKYLSLDRKLYPEIVGLIKNRFFDKIENIPFGDNDFEYLDIMKFFDQKRQNYVVTVYSDDALYSDPQVIDIFKME